MLTVIWGLGFLLEHTCRTQSEPNSKTPKLTCFHLFIFNVLEKSVL